MAALDGAGRRVDLGLGVILTAPGLRGTAELRPSALGGRDGESPRTTHAFDVALQRAGMVQSHAVEIMAQEVRPLGGDVRAPDGSDGLVLEVPSLGPQRGQVLLMTDESGVLSWHYPEHVAAEARDGTPTPQPSTRGAGATARFVVPRRVATGLPAGGAERTTAERSLVTWVGGKVLSVFVYPILAELVGAAALVLARRWEAAQRPTKFRLFDADSFSSPDAVEPDNTAWQRITSGRALLFLHGTFSTSHGSFAGLPVETMTGLSTAYGGRLIALDHPSLSVDPKRNAADILDKVSARGSHLQVDIVAHSRGGLVARALQDADEGAVSVGRIVFVGTPNQGTPLADPKHMGACIDRVTALLNLVPPGPWTAVLDVLDGVLQVVKILGQGSLGGLPGLASMDPRGEFLPLLGSRVRDAKQMYAIDANFDPTGSLAALWRLPDAALDRVFGDRQNDGVVPSEGVGRAPGAGGFTVDEHRSLHFDDRDGVWHCSYFTEQRVSAALLEWLGPDGSRTCRG